MSGEIGLFQKTRQQRGRANKTRPPIFSGRHPVHETGETLHPQVALVCPPRTDRDGIPRNVRHQLLAVRIRRSDVLPAQRHGHFGIYLVSVYALFGLSDNDILANPACKIECGQVGVNFLFRESVRPSMEIDKAQRVFQTPEAGFNPPEQMIEDLHVLKCEGKRQ